MEFGEYVAEQGHTLIRLAFVLTGDRHRAEDLTQTVLAEAFAKWNRVRATTHPNAYVRKMLVTRNIDHHRRRAASEWPMADDVLNPLIERASTTGTADDVSDREHLRDLVSQLPIRSRTVLVLRYYCDLDDSEIGTLMGLRRGSVRSLASRALDELRRHANTHPESMNRRQGMT